MDPPCLPPLLIAGVNHMQHIPEAEAQGLAQETAVLGLVVIKQRPTVQVTMGQGLAEDTRKVGQQMEAKRLLQSMTAGETPRLARAETLCEESEKATMWRKARGLRR